MSAELYSSCVRPSCLYHGSQALVARLDPRATRGGRPTNSLCAVYASHEESYAAAFALPLIPDARGRLNWSLHYTGEPRISIHAGELYPHRVGYLYRVPADRFVPLDDLQWVSYRPVVPEDYRVLDPAICAHWIQPRRKASRNPKADKSKRNIASTPSLASVAAPKMSGRLPEYVSPSAIDFTLLWQRVVARLPAGIPSLHAPDHWRRVEHNGIALAERNGADIDVVRLFALFHDSQRRHDGADPGHGARGAELASTLRGVVFDVNDERFELLRVACSWHTDHLHHDDPTIATCWDADRLDLGRVGIVPDARFMSTDAGRELAADRSDQTGEAGNTRPRAANWVQGYGGC